jgi:hypothetical protein
MEDRWSIFIDIEGFSFLHKKLEAEAHRRLNNLILDIYTIGTKVYPDYPERLFVHQLGDGFIIVSSFPEETLNRPISIALALMKSAMINGGVLKAGISSGNFADVSGMWPQVIRDNRVEGTSTLRLGGGIMTLFPVMGNALINAHKAASSAGSGPHLVVDNRIKNLFPNSLTNIDQNDQVFYLDWVESGTEVCTNILETLGYGNLASDQIKVKLKKYIQENKLPSEWVANALKYLKNG